MFIICAVQWNDKKNVCNPSHLPFANLQDMNIACSAVSWQRTICPSGGLKKIFKSTQDHSVFSLVDIEQTLIELYVVTNGGCFDEHGPLFIHALAAVSDHDIALKCI